MGPLEIQSLWLFRGQSRAEGEVTRLKMTKWGHFKENGALVIVSTPHVRLREEGRMGRSTEAKEKLLPPLGVALQGCWVKNLLV